MRLRPGDRALLTRARSEIDLPNFLTAHGWSLAADESEHGEHHLLGPQGEEIRVFQSADGPWCWVPLQSGRGGGFIEACALLRWTWTKIMKLLRAVLTTPRELGQTIPSAPVSVGGDEATLMAGETAAVPTLAARIVRDLEPTGAGALPPLAGEGRALLMEHCRLSAETVDTFASALRQGFGGRVRAPHHPGQGDAGEEHGPAGWTYVEGAVREDGPGRSLWVGAPSMRFYGVLVASNLAAGLSAWERLPTVQRTITAVVSSAGEFTDAAKRQLEHILMVLRITADESSGQDIWVYDVAGVEAEAQRLYLEELATRHGGGYRRLPMAEHGMDLGDGPVSPVADALPVADEAEHTTALTPPSGIAEPDGGRKMTRRR